MERRSSQEEAEVIMRLFHDVEAFGDMAEMQVLNVDNLAESINKRLLNWKQKKMNTKDYTISRVPPLMRKGKETYYDPAVISIGPYHHHNPKLGDMENHKWLQLGEFLARKPHIKVETYIEKLKLLEDEARRCYFEDIKMESTEFVEMMLLDGCFILEFFLKSNYGFQSDSSDSKYIAPISENSWIIMHILSDILLLENQIPFFILQSLFDIFTGKEQNQFVDLAANNILWSRFVEQNPSTPPTVALARGEIHHLLHLLHHFHVSPSEQREHKQSCPERLYAQRCSYFNFSCARPSAAEPCENVTIAVTIKPQPGPGPVPCATELQDAGITFKKSASKKITDITFRKGVLEIPHIIIDDLGKILLMNLVAYEQCNSTVNELSDYANFMDGIIDTSRDVEILQRSGILDSHLNSDEETAQYFNQLNDYVVFNSDEKGLVTEINKYCGTKWHRWRTRLIRDYFGNPWAIVSLVAAAVLLILTFLQTFFAMYSYFHPGK